MHPPGMHRPPPSRRTSPHIAPRRATTPDRGLALRAPPRAAEVVDAEIVDEGPAPPRRPGRPRTPWPAHSPALARAAAGVPPAPAARVWCRDHGEEFAAGDRRHRHCDTEPLTRPGYLGGGLGGGVVQIAAGGTGRSLERLRTGFAAFDQLVGDPRRGAAGLGMVYNGVYFLHGPEGIGKTTLLTQLAAGLAASGEVVLMVTGEEAPDQVADRARRLGVDDLDRLLLLCSSRWADVETAIRLHAGTPRDPSVVVIDSAQVMEALAHGGEAGSNMQVEAVGARARMLAKLTGRCVILVGQANADGDAKGPRALRHIVDVVAAYDRDAENRRLVRVTKNRFGAADNVLFLEMTAHGLKPLRNALPAALSGARPEPGVVAFPAVLGAGASQPLIVAVEASVDAVTEDGGRVVDAQGFALKDLRRILDTLSKHTAFPLAKRSVRVMVPTIADKPIADPALDLAVATAVLSAAADRPAPPAFGRIGLTGRVDPVEAPIVRQKALAEARLGIPVAPLAVRGARGIAHVRDLLATIAPGVFAEAPRRLDAGAEVSGNVRANSTPTAVGKGVGESGENPTSEASRSLDVEAR